MTHTKYFDVSHCLFYVYIFGCPGWSPKELLVKFSFPFFVHQGNKGRLIISCHEKHSKWYPYTKNNFYDQLLLVKKYRRMVEEGMSYRDIARHEGVSFNHVRKILKIFGKSEG